MAWAEEEFSHRLVQGPLAHRAGRGVVAPATLASASGTGPGRRPVRGRLAGAKGAPTGPPGAFHPSRPGPVVDRPTPGPNREDLRRTRSLDGRHLGGGAAEEVLAAIAEGLELVQVELRLPPAHELDQPEPGRDDARHRLRRPAGG